MSNSENSDSKQAFILTLVHQETITSKTRKHPKIFFKFRDDNDQEFTTTIQVKSKVSKWLDLEIGKQYRLTAQLHSSGVLTNAKFITNHFIGQQCCLGCKQWFESKSYLRTKFSKLAYCEECLKNKLKVSKQELTRYKRHQERFKSNIRQCYLCKVEKDKSEFFNLAFCTACCNEVVECSVCHNSVVASSCSQYIFGNKIKCALCAVKTPTPTSTLKPKFIDYL